MTDTMMRRQTLLENAPDADVVREMIGFAAQAARMIHKAGGSLRDVQQLAGHRSLKTAEGDIEGNAVAQQKLIRLI